jgi:NADH-quinone oxidoreductase subunit L
MNTVVALIPIIPFIGFLLIGLGNKKLPHIAVNIIACGSIGISFIFGLISFTALLGMIPESRFIHVKLFDWIVSGTFNTSISFNFDPLAAIMVLVVTGVGLMIHIYSIGYMAHDSGYSRYFAFLNLFTFAMLVLVLADNMLLMFVGWEGVGLCSYLLIGFWFHKKSATDAGKKAFIVNRLGDFGFLLGTMLIFWTFGTLNINDISIAAPQILQTGGGVVTAMALLLFLGATGKSAQIPLYVWLPDAMEGPTPVSALIHAATMVTAGVYMVTRLSALYVLAPVALLVMAIIGAVTALYAGTIALTQNDIKKVLAYSTISQIGYMFLACGVAAFSAGIFHLMTHAFFKALLFLGAGSIIHALSGEQDMRKMGGLKNRLPKTYRLLFIATLAIAGIPVFAGFFSKDEILWQAYSSQQGSPLLWLLGLMAAILTAFYMFRLIFLTFYGKSNLLPETASHVHESPKVMLIPLYVLAFLSIVGGFIGLPHSLGGGAWFERFLEPAIASSKAAIELPISHSSFSEYSLMLCSITAALLGIFAAYQLYVRNPDIPKRIVLKFKSIYGLLLNKYYVDELYDYAIVKPIYVISLIFWKLFDIKVIDASVNGMARLTGTFSQRVRLLHTGFVRNYALIFLVGVVFLLGYFVLR